MRRDLSGKLVLITGAASGIGQATAYAFAQKGARLLLCDKNAAELENVVKQTQAEAFWQIDLTLPEDLNHIVTELHQRFEMLDILVNNAGVALAGGLTDTNIQDWQWVFATNFWAPTYLIQNCWPLLKKAKHPQIIQVASITSFWPLPQAMAYSASKAALLNFSLSFATQAAQDNVQISTICPGFVNTQIIEHARFGQTHSAAERANIAKIWQKHGIASARVAKVILRRCMKPKLITLVGLDAHILYWLQRLSPRLVVWLQTRQAKRSVSIQTDVRQNFMIVFLSML